MRNQYACVKYYEGTPIPASIIIVIILGVAFRQGRIDHLLPLGSIRTDALNHRTNTGQGIGQTSIRVSDRSRYRRLAGRNIVIENGGR